MRTKEELRNISVDFAYYIHLNKLGDCSHEKHKEIFEEWIEQKLIDQEPKQTEVSEELEYQNLTCLVNGFELTGYQKGLAKLEYEKLIKSKTK